MEFIDSVTITCKPGVERADILVNEKDLAEAIANTDTPEKVSELSDAIKDQFKVWSDWIDESKADGIKEGYDKGFLLGAVTVGAAVGIFALVKWLSRKKQ